jgi:hypothetical protein
MRGAELDDPDCLLTATKTARYMRQIRVSAGQPLPAATIRRLLLEAARVNIERAALARRWRVGGRKR